MAHPTGGGMLDIRSSGIHAWYAHLQHRHDRIMCPRIKKDSHSHILLLSKPQNFTVLSIPICFAITGPVACVFHQTRCRSFELSTGWTAYLLLGCFLESQKPGGVCGVQPLNWSFKTGMRQLRNTNTGINKCTV